MLPMCSQWAKKGVIGKVDRLAYRGEWSGEVTDCYVYSAVTAVEKILDESRIKDWRKENCVQN